jgi:multidrug resistance efflux pump
MRRFLAWGISSLLFAAILPAQEELPKDPGEPLDIEPPLLIQESPNRNVVHTTPDTAPAGQQVLDPERIGIALEKAKKSAASGERLYKAGIIAKVEAEHRVLKVVRLEADLAQAKLEVAKEEVAAQQARVASGEIPESETVAAVSALALATQEAEAAVAKRDRAELDAARLNLQRQKKLLAMGSGRKSEVSRAQEKVSALQQSKE